MMKAAIKSLMEEPTEDMEDYEEKKANWKPRPHLEKISAQLRLNTGIIFTNGDLSEIKEVIFRHGREAPAKVGAIAPDNVTIKAGPTGLDPKQTQFFQALQIPTKIMKGQIEIVSDEQVITQGEKVSASQAALLEKLKIRPFQYRMEIKNVLDNGQIFSAKVLDISADDVLESFSKCASNVTALSLGSGFVIPSAAPHLILNAFKNLAAASFGSGYSFAQAEALKSAAAAAPAAGSAGPAAAKAEDKPAEKEESEEEEADLDMDDLFG